MKQQSPTYGQKSLTLQLSANERHPITLIYASLWAPYHYLHIFGLVRVALQINYLQPWVCQKGQVIIVTSWNMNAN